MARTYGKNRWALFLIILAGIVVGSFIGYLTRNIKYLSWLDYSMNFSIGDVNNKNIVYVDLGVLIIQFGFQLKITIASIIGVIAAVFIYRRM